MLEESKRAGVEGGENKLEPESWGKKEMRKEEKELLEQVRLESRRKEHRKKAEATRMEEEQNQWADFFSDLREEAAQKHLRKLAGRR